MTRWGTVMCACAAAFGAGCKKKRSASVVSCASAALATFAGALAAEAGASAFFLHPAPNAAAQAHITIPHRVIALSFAWAPGRTALQR